MSVLKKRMIGVAFALAVVGSGVYGVHKFVNLPDAVISHEHMASMIGDCQDQGQRDLQGCVLGKIFLWSLPIEIAQGGVFLGAAAGLMRYRRQILKLG